MEYKMFESPSKVPSFTPNNEPSNLVAQSSSVQNPSIIIQNPAVTTSMVIHQKFGRHPIVMTCPFCKTTMKTKVRKVHPFWDLFSCLCCFCACSCKKKNHLCDQCGAYLGMCDK